MRRRHARSVAGGPAILQSDSGARWESAQHLLTRRQHLQLWGCAQQGARQRGDSRQDVLAVVEQQQQRRSPCVPATVLGRWRPADSEIFRAEATTLATSAGAASGLKSHSTAGIPCAESRHPTSMARRVLPHPGGPGNVTGRASRSARSTTAKPTLRPTSRVSGIGRFEGLEVEDGGLVSIGSGRPVSRSWRHYPAADCASARNQRPPFRRAMDPPRAAQPQRRRPDSCASAPADAASRHRAHPRSG